MSRAQRESTFMKAAVGMYAHLEDWYDQHPNASFGEIEAEARQARRKLMGEVLAVLINGRDSGYQWEVPRCSKCGESMEFERYRSREVRGLEGDTELSRAYYVCPRCQGQTLSPPGP